MGKGIKIRRQRSRVGVPCAQRGTDAEWRLPGEVHTTLETMLPKGKGKFLELWAPDQDLTPGWNRISQSEDVSAECLYQLITVKWVQDGWISMDLS